MEVRQFHIYRGPQTWDIVPNEIKNSSSLEQFKQKIKLWKPLTCKCRLCKVYLHNIGFIS